MMFALDVDVEVQVQAVKVVAREPLPRKAEQLRERDVIAASDFPVAFVQWLEPARGWVWWGPWLPSQEQGAIFLLFQDPLDVFVPERLELSVFAEPAVI